MRKYNKLVGSIVILVIGVIVTFASSAIVEFLPSWIWQLGIGVTLIVGGGFLLEVTNEKAPDPVFFIRDLYGTIGAIVFVVGIVVLANVARYDEILQLAGSWPVYLLGGILTGSGVILLIHHLTTFERHVAGLDKKGASSGSQSR